MNKKEAIGDDLPRRKEQGKEAIPHQEFYLEPNIATALQWDRTRDLGAKQLGGDAM